MRLRIIYVPVLLVLVSMLLLMTGCGRKQHVSFSYSFAISPKKGDVLKDVTVYLPFPSNDGKPVVKIYESLMRDYKKYWAQDYPDAKTSLVKTKHGPMLKVSVPEIDERGFGLGGGYGFEEPFSKEPVAPRFPINPRLNSRKLDGYETGHLCDSYIYATFDNANDMGLALDYGISARSPSLLPLDYVPEDNYYAHVGWDSIPGNSEVLVKYFPSNGWMRIPLADLGYDKE